MDVVKPRWTTSSYLLYAGGIIVLFAAVGALAYLSSQYGDAAYAGWAAFILVVLYAIAHAFSRSGRWIAAGVFAFVSVIAWAVFIDALWSWFGWLKNSTSGSPFAGFSVARLSLELLVLAAVFHGMRRFRFPFLAAIGVFVGWLFVADLISGGGNWTAVVTLVVGLLYFAVGAASDKPSSFWLHFAAGVLIGGAFLYWGHSGDTSWSLIAVASLVYVLIADRTHRSSWAVFGTIGFLMAATHFTVVWSSGHLVLSPAVIGNFRGWVPAVVFAFVGFLLVALGLFSRRRNPVIEPLTAD